ncbi:MAG TPA: TolC family protein [Pedomonas sp.]|uniref:TolC family protein n=1 Tax=Pedomonas sp. TaxID=2976421 RepID=UPI002F421B48
MKRPALWLLLLTTACSHVGPDYAGPRSRIAAAPSATGEFSAATRAGPFTDDPVPGQWWRLYRTSELDQLVSEALAANTDLAVALANIEESRALLAEALAQRQVRGETTGGVTLDRERRINGAAPVELGFEAGITLRYDLDVAGRLKRLIEAANADVEAAQAAYDLMRLTVAADTAAAYVDACAAGYRHNAAQRSVALQEETLALTERLIQGGRGGALDRSRAAAELARLRAPLPAFQAARQNALFRLAVLLGRPPAQFPQDLAACRTLPSLNAPIPVGDGAGLLRRRPDVRQAERQIAAATARIGLAMADLYPRIEFGAGAGIGTPFEDLGDDNSFRFGLGPLVTWTFPNRSAVEARIRRAEASEQAALARFDAAVLRALSDVETALSAYARELDANDALKASRDSAAKVVEQTHQLFRLGRADSLAVLDAQRMLADAEAQLAASDAQLAAYQINLFRALGGGWEVAPSAS